ncbi:MAG: hypothetical protein A2149_00370 [Candidatus Schekmanbacteria bacterium RBG_16_38_11]|uniref:Ribokinase n=1 Tax=Candidatus Schekmanbacteria bacterium RBG_16_38_11 TaxID=1817880 RepID=A0A1F7S004_9BACT|nr:MAG: hypothetical protein A2149_00370 [Candidatus Schekmanbacteria bacterium RBG_16_38_11]
MTYWLTMENKDWEAKASLTLGRGDFSRPWRSKKIKMDMKEPLVTVVGSSNVDFVIKAKKLPQKGETVTGGIFFKAYGGKGANQAVAAKRAGAQVNFITKLGNDIFGKEYLRYLKKTGVRMDGIIIDNSFPTGMAFIVVDRKGENQIAVSPGANTRLTPHEVGKKKVLISEAGVMLIQLEIPVETVIGALKIAKGEGILTILNPAPVKKLSAKIFSLIDIITPNEVEASNLTGVKINDIKSAEKAGRKLLSLGVKAAVITLGAKGSVLISSCQEDFDKGNNPSLPPLSKGGNSSSPPLKKGDSGGFSKMGKVKTLHIKGIRVKAIDSTAAGDAFNGALACALAEGINIEEAVKFANCAGALAVTKTGAQSSLPVRREIEALMEKNSGSRRL